MASKVIKRMPTVSAVVALCLFFVRRHFTSLNAERASKVIKRMLTVSAVVALCLFFVRRHFTSLSAERTLHEPQRDAGPLQALPTFEVTIDHCSITYRKRVDRLRLLRGRNRSPAFWSDEDWWFFCVSPFLPFLSAAHFRPLITVALVVFLNDVFNSTLGYACNIPCTLRFLRPAVP